MNHSNSVLDDSALLALFNEDVPYGDLTTQALQLPTKQASIEYSARYDMCCCGAEEVVRLLQLKGLTAKLYAPSGSVVPAGTTLITATGSTDTVLSVWKITQNLMEWSSGIASAAQQLVQQATSSNPNITIACTRKNTPGTKAMSIKAIRTGGATVHRLGLSESILIFPEHLQFTHLSPEQLIVQTQQYCPELNSCVEVTTIDEAITWALAGASTLQLEKFTPEQIEQCRNALTSKQLTPMLAAAGGVNANNAATYASSGADILVTSWPYQARPKDVQMRFTPL